MLSATLLYDGDQNNNDGTIHYVHPCRRERGCPMRNIILSTYVTLDGVMKASEQWTPQFSERRNAGV